MRPTPSPLDDARLRREALAPPPGYFDGPGPGLADRVLAEAATRGITPAPVAPQRLRQFPFVVPVGYFEALPQRVMARVGHALSWRRRAAEWLEALLPMPVLAPPLLRLAPALATVSLLVVVGLWLGTGRRAPAPVAIEQPWVEAVALQLSGSADEALLIEALSQSGSELPLPAEALDPQAVDAYLIESDADLTTDLSDAL